MAVAFLVNRIGIMDQHVPLNAGKAYRIVIDVMARLLKQLSALHVAWVGMLMVQNVQLVVCIASLEIIQNVIHPLENVKGIVKLVGLVNAVILTVMYLTANYVQIKIKIYAMNAMVGFIVIRILLVSLVQVIALTEQYVISGVVRVVKVAMTNGQANSATYHAHPTADSATS